MDFAFFPAVDLRGGKCVQLVGGVPGTEVVALDDPLFQAERWVAEGADHLHIIDLDGAILGKRINAPNMMTADRRNGAPGQKTGVCGPVK